MKRSTIEAAAIKSTTAIGMEPVIEDEAGLSIAMRGLNKSFAAGAEWALEQVREDLKHFIEQVKETNGYYTFELNDLPGLCDVEDDK